MRRLFSWSSMGLPFHVAILLCGAIGALTGLVFGFLLGLRLRGIYQGIATFAVGEALVTLWLNVDYIGGASGLQFSPDEDRVSGNPDPGRGEPALRAPAWIDRASVCRFDPSAITKRQRAIRGIDVRRMKVLAWVCGCTLTGIGGSLFAHRVGAISPPEFGFYLSLNILIAPVIGGIQTYTAEPSSGLRSSIFCLGFFT